MQNMVKNISQGRPPKTKRVTRNSPSMGRDGKETQTCRLLFFKTDSWTRGKGQTFPIDPHMWVRYRSDVTCGREKCCPISRELDRRSTKKGAFDERNFKGRHWRGGLSNQDGPGNAATLTVFTSNPITKTKVG